MKFNASNIRLQYNDKMQAEIILSTKGNMTTQADIQALREVIDKGKELVVEVKTYRKHRSLDSNAYMWLLLGDIAQAIKTSKDEVYLQMLDRYGVYTHIVVKPEIVERVKTEWKTVRELGEVIINGKAGIQLQCYFGSSTYTNLEMCKLLDGVISECKELGVETATPRELDIINSSWGTK